MIGAPDIRAITALYRKHGWRLRRVLLSRPMRNSLGKNVEALFEDAEIVDSALDAAWFSRTSRPGSTAWEIRHLGETPFALVEVIDNDSGTETTAGIHEQAEVRMAEIIAKKSRAA